MSYRRRDVDVESIYESRPKPLLVYARLILTNYNMTTCYS